MFKKILIGLTLIGSVAFSCEVKDIHNSVESVKKLGGAKVVGKKLIIDTPLMVLTFKDMAADETTIKNVLLAFEYYAKSHGLTVEFTK